MHANFAASLAHVFAYEGGYSNDPHDAGGETNRGISKRSYPHEDIHGMTVERAGAIYRRDFWDRNRCDDLPDGVDFVVFDAAVNSGSVRSVRWLQFSLGVSPDGVIGPKTLAACHAAAAPALIEDTVGRRMAFLQSLPSWERYKGGWTRRVRSVREEALKMAAKLPLPPVPPTSTPAPDAHANRLTRLWRSFLEAWRR